MPEPLITSTAVLDAPAASTEHLIPVMFVGSGPDRQAAAVSVLDALVTGGVGEATPWWFPEHDLRHVDGNDNGVFFVIDADKAVKINDHVAALHAENQRLVELINSERGSHERQIQNAVADTYEKFATGLKAQNPHLSVHFTRTDELVELTFG